MRTSARLIGLLLFLSLTMGIAPSDQLINPMIQVESKGVNGLVGDLHLDDHAYGVLQIRQPVCDDVNRAYGTKITAQQCQYDKALSIKVWRLYLNLHSKGITDAMDIRFARRWNGGPNGDKKTSTRAYAKKVQKELLTNRVKSKTPIKPAKSKGA